MAHPVGRRRRQRRWLLRGAPRVAAGTAIHYLHVKGVGPNPKPIILSHGRPWTFWDWRKVIGPLTDPAAHGGDPADAFDVVVPSLPGFGYSVPLTDTGFGARKIADYWHVLMTEVLGYSRYAAGGGDWGSTTTGELGHGYPESVVGVWLTLPNVPGVRLRDITEADFAPEEKWMWAVPLQPRGDHRVLDRQHERQTPGT
jgi:pimeloyl-ACP methyl ester carboxylesterase